MKKTLSALLLLLLSITSGICQTDSVIYLNSKFRPVPKSQAHYYRVQRVTDATTGKGYRQDFFITGEKYQEVSFSKVDSVRDGATTVWYKNGEIRSIDNYLNNKLEGAAETFFEDGERQYLLHYKQDKLHGEVKSFHANRQLRRHDVFKDGELVEGHCYDEYGAEVPHYPHMLMPQYPGGQEAMMGYIGRSVRIPFGMRLQGAEGVAYVSFVIDKYGSVSDVEVIKATHAALGKETARVVKSMSKWEPGQLEGEKIAVKFTVPVRIKLAE